MRRNPRNTRWTILYRRKHRKGTQEEASKKRTRRGNLKFNRAIQGATLESILQKRNQKPEVRKAQREQAIRYDLNINLVDSGDQSWHFISFFFFFFGIERQKKRQLLRRRLHKKSQLARYVIIVCVCAYVNDVHVCLESIVVVWLD